LLVLGFCCETKSQTNLVYNGDFEMYSSCPVSESSPSQAPNYEINKCVGWTCATFGTSDYFNSCSVNLGISVPSNYDGYQFAKSGNGYVGGFFTSYTGGAGTDGYNGVMWWEYIQGQLTQSLVANHKYKISMFVSLAEYSDLYIKEFGIYTSQNPLTSPNTAALSLVPQVTFLDNNYFRDTINWVKVEGEFIATGGEKYLTIGNFNDNVTTDTLRRYYSTNIVMPFVTYFYIDDVEMYDITDEKTLPECILNFPNVFTPNSDGINDVFSFKVCDHVIKSTIYDRWGLKVFETDKVNYYWDGRTTSGEKCTDGNYFYVIQTKEKVYKGFVQLIR